MSERQGPPVQFRSIEVEPQLAARVRDVTVGSPGRVAARDLERYYAAIAAELRRLDLSRNEAMLIIDSLNGVLHHTPEAEQTMLWAGISDSIELDGLDGKWEVDGAALVAKLRALSLVGALAVIDASERYWVAVERDEEPTPESVGLA